MFVIVYFSSRNYYYITSYQFTVKDDQRLLTVAHTQILTRVARYQLRHLEQPLLNYKRMLFTFWCCS